MAHDERHSYRVLVHVSGRSAIALAPETMMAATETIVAHKDHQRPVAEPQCVELGQNASDVVVHGRHSRKVALEHLAISQAPVGQRRSPGMPLLLRAALKGTAPIGINDVLRMAIPRAVWRRIVHAEIERALAKSVRVKPFQGVIGYALGNITGLIDQLAIADHRGIIVGAAPSLVHVPVTESMLRDLAGTEMPLAADRTVPAVGREHVSVADFLRQVLGSI